MLVGTDTRRKSGKVWNIITTILIYILKHTPNSKMKWKMANGLRQKWLLSKCAILMTGAKCSTIILRKMYFNDHIWKLNYILYHLSVLFRFICLTAIVYCALCRDQFLENVMEWNPISHWSIINIFITIATYKMEIAFKPQTKLLFDLYMKCQPKIYMPTKCGSAVGKSFISFICNVNI